MKLVRRHEMTHAVLYYAKPYHPTCMKSSASVGRSEREGRMYSVNTLVPLRTCEACRGRAD